MPSPGWRATVLARLKVARRTAGQSLPGRGTAYAADKPEVRRPGACTRRVLAVGIGGAAIIALAALARAEQNDIRLSDGDDVTIDCPTQLTVEFDGGGGAVVSCSGEAGEPEPSAAAQP